jgi:hypothetical protein
MRWNEWRRWLDRLTFETPRQNTRTPSRRRRSRPLQIEALEDRTVPASVITIIDGAAGTGTLDNLLGPTQGTVVASDSPGATATLSVGALAGVNPDVNISITAENAIFFTNPNTALSLQTGGGHSASFAALAAGITFTPSAKGLSAAGGDINLTAAGDITLGAVQTANGSVHVVSNTANIRDDGDDATAVQAAHISLTAAKAIGGDTAITAADVVAGNTASFRGALDVDPGAGTLSVAQTGVGGNVQLRRLGADFGLSLLPNIAPVGSGKQLALIGAGHNLLVDSAVAEPAAGNVNLLLGATGAGSVVVNNSVSNPGTTGVTNLVTATTGTISGTGTVTALNLSLTTGGGAVGTNATTPLLIDATLLNVSSSGGDITLSDATGGLVVGLVNAGTGTVRLTVNAGGTITGTAVDGTADIVGGTVVLRAPAGGSFGQGLTNPLEINATNLDAAVAGGAGTINVRDTGGGLTVTGATTVNGEVFLDAAGTASNLTVQTVSAPGKIVALSATGAILASGSGTNVTAASLVARLATGVGTAGAKLATAVTTFAASVTTTGVFLSNNAALTIGTVNVTGVGNVSGVVATGSDIVIGAVGPLTLANNVQTTGNITLTGTDTAPASANDNVVVNSGVTVRSTGGTVTLQAGDTVNVLSGATVQASGVATLSGDFQDTGDGGGVTIAGTVTGTSVSVTGGTGTDNLLVNFAGGASLPVGLSFTGGGGSDTMTVSDQGGTAVRTYRITSTSVSRNGGPALTYSGIEALVVKGGDSVDTFNVQGTLAATPLTLNGGGGNDVFNFSSDAPANTGNLSGLAGVVTVDAGGGVNTLNVSEAGSPTPDTVTLTGTAISGTAAPFTINYSASGGTFGTINLTTGSGADTVNVQGTLAGGTTTVNTGGGNDVLNVSSPTNLLTGLAGPLVVDAGAGANQLTVSESGSTTADNLTLSTTQVTSSVHGFTVTYQATGGTFRSLTLTATQAADTITVQSVPPGVTTTVQGAGGDDAFNVQAASASNYTGLTLDGGDGSDTLTMTDTEGGAVIRNLASDGGSGLVGVGFVGGKTTFHYQTIESVQTGVTADQNFVQALFHRILGRNATAAEVGSFVQKLQQKGARAVTKELEFSLEARQRTVNGWFQQFGGRPPTAEEMGKFVQQLLRFKEERVLGQILALTGHKGPKVGDEQFVRNLYRNLLGTAPTAQQFEKTLAVLRKSGRAAAAQQVQEGPEYRTQIIQNYFQALLGRAATADELQGLVQGKKDLRNIRIDLESSAAFMSDAF